MNLQGILRMGIFRNEFIVTHDQDYIFTIESPFDDPTTNAAIMYAFMSEGYISYFDCYGELICYHINGSIDKKYVEFVVFYINTFFETLTVFTALQSMVSEESLPIGEVLAGAINDLQSPKGVWI